MKTKLIITLPSKGVPHKILQGVEEALHAYYDDTPMGRAWTLPDKPPMAIWNTEIELVPETPEDEAEADRIAGVGEGRADPR